MIREMMSRRTVVASLGSVFGGRSNSGRAQDATPAATPAFGGNLLSSTANDFGPVTAGQEYRLVLLIPFPADGFWTSVKESAVDRGRADGITLDVVELSEPSVPEQLGQIADAITALYDGVLLGPVDPAGISPGVVELNAARIPVIAIDNAPIGGEIISLVRTDNVAAARTAGGFVGQKLTEGTVLNIQGNMENQVAQDRDRGFREGLGNFESIQIISDQGNWDSFRASVLTSQQLPQAEEGTPAPPAPLIDAVFAAGPAMTVGAANAVERVKADTVFVVGFGATDETLDLIRSGLVEAIAAEYPTRAGAIAVDMMVNYLDGASVTPFINSGHALVTQTNLDEFIASGA